VHVRVYVYVCVRDVRCERAIKCWCLRACMHV